MQPLLNAFLTKRRSQSIPLLNKNNGHNPIVSKIQRR
jgi:hypothetical protein